MMKKLLLITNLILFCGMIYGYQKVSEEKNSAQLKLIKNNKNILNDLLAEWGNTKQKIGLAFKRQQLTDIKLNSIDSKKMVSCDETLQLLKSFKDKIKITPEEVTASECNEIKSKIGTHYRYLMSFIHVEHESFGLRHVASNNSPTIKFSSEVFNSLTRLNEMEFKTNGEILIIQEQLISKLRVDLLRLDKRYLDEDTKAFEAERKLAKNETGLKELELCLSEQLQLAKEIVAEIRGFQGLAERCGY